MASNRGHATQADGRNEDVQRYCPVCWWSVHRMANGTVVHSLGWNYSGCPFGVASMDSPSEGQGGHQDAQHEGAPLAGLGAGVGAADWEGRGGPTVSLLGDCRELHSLSRRRPFKTDYETVRASPREELRRFRQGTRGDGTPVWGDAPEWLGWHTYPSKFPELLRPPEVVQAGDPRYMGANPLDGPEQFHAFLRGEPRLLYNEAVDNATANGSLKGSLPSEVRGGLTFEWVCAILFTASVAATCAVALLGARLCH